MGAVSIREGETIYSIPSNGYAPELFPKWEQIVPTNQGVQVKLNADYLKRIADAITSDGQVTLTFNDKAPSTLAVHVEGDEGYGVIMPIRM